MLFSSPLEELLSTSSSFVFLVSGNTTEKPPNFDFFSFAKIVGKVSEGFPLLVKLWSFVSPNPEIKATTGEQVLSKSIRYF